MRRQRGFTIAEVLIASAIAFAIGWLLLRLVQSAIVAGAQIGTRANASSSADRLAERLDSDAASAWSVFVPDADVEGNDNANGHEVDFVNEDASHREYWWAYDYEAGSQTVTAYTYSPGAAPSAGQQFAGITSFGATVYAVTSISDPASTVYDPLFANATATPVDFDFGWNSRALGGNRFVRVAFKAAGVVRDLVLSSATAPSHFTVVVPYTPAP